MTTGRNAGRATAVAAAVSILFSLATGTAGASRSSSHNTKGPITCSLSGTFTASPALSLGSGKATKLTLIATLTGCTGSSSASKVVSGTVSGHSFDISASCVAFENAFPPLVGTVSYKTSSGSAGVTKLSFNGGTLNYMAMPVTITYPKKGGSGSARGRSRSRVPR